MRESAQTSSSPSHKGVCQCFSRGNSPGWVKGQALVQEIDERHQHLAFIVLELHRGGRHQSRTQVPRGLRYVNFLYDILLKPSDGDVTVEKTTGTHIPC